MRGPQALPGPQAGQPPGPARREAQGRGAATRAGQCGGVAAGRADTRPAKAEGPDGPRPVTGPGRPRAPTARPASAHSPGKACAQRNRRRRREAALPGRAREQRQAGAALMAAGHEREKGARRAPARHRCEASAASGAGARPAARRVGVERPQARRGVAPAKQAQGPAIPAASSAPRATCGARADGGIAPSSAGCVVAVRAPQGGRARLPCIPARDRSRSGCRRIAAGAPQASCSQGQHCPYHSGVHHVARAGAGGRQWATRRRQSKLGAVAYCHGGPYLRRPGWPTAGRRSLPVRAFGRLRGQAPSGPSQ